LKSNEEASINQAIKLMTDLKPHTRELFEQMNRSASFDRTTRETAIQVELNLDGTGQKSIATGIGFFDHMLELFATHGLFDLQIKAEGDLHVDFHHTVEDVGICLGRAFANALGDKVGIRRYGFCILPMDEALTRVVVDCGGRPFLRFEPGGVREPIGLFPFQLIEEFLRAFATNAGMNLHVDVLSGRDSHHIAESIFKGLARALDAATSLDERVTSVPSTKGSL
jgi:imidazoleglycerol-phosphate dehydratase